MTDTAAARATFGGAECLVLMAAELLREWILNNLVHLAPATWVVGAIALRRYARKCGRVMRTPAMAVSDHGLNNSAPGVSFKVAG